MIRRDGREEDPWGRNISELMTSKPKSTFPGPEPGEGLEIQAANATAFLFRQPIPLDATHSAQVGSEEGLAPRKTWREMPHGAHFVQVYEAEEGLLEALSGFVGEGLGVGDACLVVATAEHRAVLAERLRENGIDPTHAEARGRYLAVDAAETIKQFSPQGPIEPGCFREVVAGLLACLAPGSGHVRIFGEMVALLWGQGRPEEALELEALWNEVHQQSTVPFTLFCAYPLHEFAQDARGEQFLQMCGQHGQIIPAESYSALTSADTRLQMIGLLQQKATTLETAIEAHREAEARSREQSRLATLQMEVSTALTTGSTLSETLDHCVQALVKHLDAAFAGIWTLDRAGQEPHLQASAGLSPYIDGGHAHVPVDTGKIEHIAQSRRPYVTNDVRHDTEISTSEWVRHEGIEAFAGYPLLSGGRLVGVVALLARHALSEAMLQALAAIAKGIALGIERGQMQEERARLLLREQEARAEAEENHRRLYELFRRVEASEARLRQEQERLSIALSASQTGTFRWDPNSGEFLDFDANLKELFGFAPDTPVPSTEDFLARVHPEDAPTVIPAIERCRQGADFEQEYRVIHPDGSIHWLYDRARMQRDENGHLTYLIGVCTDITRRKQMEEALRHTAEHLRLLAESMPQKIFTATPNGDVDYFNPQWTEFTGMSFEEIRAWGWTQFIHPEDLEENLRRWKQALATGEPFYCEHRFRRADGVYRWHVSRAIPIRDDAGTIIMWVGANTEIEEQKQLEERKDEFLRMASHDLRTPLTAMKGNLQLAQRQLARLLAAAEETASKKGLSDIALLLSRALRQTDVQQRLIGDLLDVSRIQAGKLELSLEPCDLVPLVREIVLDQQAAAPVQPIHLVLPPAEEEVLVLIDEARIGQVIGNYLSNALKYSPASASVEVGLAVQDGHARLWVRDQGQGLSAEQQQHVWERFYQAPGIEVQSGSSQGMGLGLHICQTFITRHGGRVGVESEPRKGATFWFTLPLLGGEEGEVETDR